MKCEKLGNHTISYQSLLLSTIVLNDILSTIVLNDILSTIVLNDILSTIVLNDIKYYRT